MLDLGWLIVQLLIRKVLWYVILTPGQHLIADPFSALIAGTGRVSPLVQKWKIFEDIKADTMCIAFRTKNKRARNIHNHARRHYIETYSWKNRGICSLDYPKYKLIKDLVHYILSSCDVHNGLRYHDESFKQVPMFLRAITHREASLHGMELILSLDLHCG